jgi:polysaccharide export outer membrane protein
MRSIKNIVLHLLPGILVAAFLGLLPVNVAAQSTGNNSPAAGAQSATSDAAKTSSDSPAQPGVGYIIGPGDVLSINVWRETEISQKLVVRPDGMITLPLVGDVTANGETPEGLALLVSKKLETILTNPQVQVIVAEVHSKSFVVVGNVTKPGQFPLTRPTTVIEAVSLAGGFRDFAKTSKMYVLHAENGKKVRIPFNYKKVVSGKSGQDVEISSGDTIVVP